MKVRKITSCSLVNSVLCAVIAGGGGFGQNIEYEHGTFNGGEQNQRDDRHTLYLAAVNGAESTDVEAKISVAGWKPTGGPQVFELNGPDKVASNPFGSSDKVNIHDKPVTLKPASMSYSFPAHSISILELSGN